MSRIDWTAYRSAACGVAGVVVFSLAPQPATAQETPPRETSGPAPVVASPVSNPAPGLRATPAGTPGPPGAAPPPVAQPVATGPGVSPASGLVMGPRVSAEQVRSRAIESVRPQRVKVYPDDPDSAWWEINPRYAFARAQREQKPLLLLFTAIWNAQCMALSEEVFSTKSFNEYVKENLIICYLNYPRSLSEAPDSMRRVKEKFKVKGYPNVILFNPNGEVLRGITGYRSGRPVDYFNELKTVCHPVLLAIEEQKKEFARYGFRDWSNYEGKVIFARFRKRDDAQVTLQDATGQEWTIPINDLAPDDQRLVESFPAVSQSPPEGRP